MFKDKKPLYAAEQGLELTKSLTKYTKWGKAEIDARQKELAALAVKAWPI
jgi:hypothetical protein